MTEQKNVHKKSRAALVALAACAALCISAGAVNVATDGVIWEKLYNLVQINAFKSEAQLGGGETVTLYLADVDLKNRDGRAILVVSGEETDITDALNQEGKYHYERSDGGTVCTVDVTGTPEHWSMDIATYDEDGESSMVFTKTSEDDGGLQSSVTIVGGKDGAAEFDVESETWTWTEDALYEVETPDAE